MSRGPSRASAVLAAALGVFYKQILFLIPQGSLQDRLGAVPGMSPNMLQTQMSEDSCSAHLAGSFRGSLGGSGCSALPENSFLQEVEDSSSPELMQSHEGNKQSGRSEIQSL